MGAAAGWPVGPRQWSTRSSKAVERPADREVGRGGFLLRTHREGCGGRGWEGGRRRSPRLRLPTPLTPAGASAIGSGPNLVLTSSGGGGGAAHPRCRHPRPREVVVLFKRFQSWQRLAWCGSPGADHPILSRWCPRGGRGLRCGTQLPPRVLFRSARMRGAQSSTMAATRRRLGVAPAPPPSGGPAGNDAIGPAPGGWGLLPQNDTTRAAVHWKERGRGPRCPSKNRRRPWATRKPLGGHPGRLGGTRSPFIGGLTQSRPPAGPFFDL